MWLLLPDRLGAATQCLCFVARFVLLLVAPQGAQQGGLCLLNSLTACAVHERQGRQSGVVCARVALAQPSLPCPFLLISPDTLWLCVNWVCELGSPCSAGLGICALIGVCLRVSVFVHGLLCWLGAACLTTLSRQAVSPQAAQVVCLHTSVVLLLAAVSYTAKLGACLLCPRPHWLTNSQPDTF